MNDNEDRNRQMFLRVQDFGAGHAGEFVPTSLGKQLFTDLDAIIVELNTHTAAEVSGFGEAYQGTATRREAREALRNTLATISRIARAMSGEVPGLDDKFRVPPPANDQRLLSAGRAAAVDAAPISAQFIAHELPATFIADLNDDIADLETAIGNQSGGVGDHVTAAVGIDEAIARGVEVVRRLDAIVRTKYANNPMVLAEWTRAKHVERGPRRQRPVTPSPPQPPPAP